MSRSGCVSVVFPYPQQQGRFPAMHTIAVVSRILDLVSISVLSYMQVQNNMSATKPSPYVGVVPPYTVLISLFHAINSIFSIVSPLASATLYGASPIEQPLTVIVDTFVLVPCHDAFIVSFPLK